MTATTTEDLAEWRARLADALKAAFQAMDARAAPGEILMLRARIHTIEDEGRRRGFLPLDRARG